MDTLNYVLFTNPVSSGLGSLASSALNATGIRAKSTVPQAVVKEVLHSPWQALGSDRIYIRLAGLTGATATILGSIGAHKQFPDNNDEQLKKIFETSNRFHFISALAFIGIPFCRRPHLSGVLLAGGTILFCGPMYYRSLTGDAKAKINKVTPFGGLLLISAWISMML